MTRDQANWTARLLSALAILTLVVFPGCKQNKKKREGSGAPAIPTSTPGTDDSIAATGPGAFDPAWKTSPNFFTQTQVPVSSQSHGGDVQIWYSTNIQENVTAGTLSVPVPVGTVAIKEGRKPDGSQEITVMIKKEAGSEITSWEFSKYSTPDQLATDESGAPMQGQVAMCVGCHQSHATMDFLAGLGMKSGGTPVNPGGGGTSGPGAFRPDFATSTDFFTPMTAAETLDSEHGQGQIWYSQNLQAAVGSTPFAAPEGSVAILKFDHPTKGRGHAVMIKKNPGFDAAGQDWYYEVRNEAGDAIATDTTGAQISGPTATDRAAVTACIECHGSRFKDSDYLGGLGRIPSAGGGGGGGSGGGGTTNGPGFFDLGFSSKPTEYFSQTAGMYVSSTSFGHFRLWYSKNLEPLIDQDPLEAPEDTVAIKEYDADKNGSIDGYAVMIKKSEGAGSVEDSPWIFQQWTVFGSEISMSEQELATCAQCHRGAPANKDWLLGTHVKDSQPPNPSAGGPGPGVFDPQYASSVGYFSQTRSFKPASSYHGHVRIFYSNNLQGMFTQSGFAAPQGSVAVMESINNQQGEARLAVMIKMFSGFDPAGGDWYYEMRQASPPHGRLNDPVPGANATCKGCHGSGGHKDFLRGTGLTD